MLLEEMGSLFNSDEIREICFLLRIDYDDLGAVGKRAKIRELILHCSRIGCLQDLILYCQQMRPNGRFPDASIVPNRWQLVGETGHEPETITTAVSRLWEMYGQKAVKTSHAHKVNAIDWGRGLEKYYRSLYKRVGFVRILGRREVEPLENVFTHVNVLDKLSAERRYGIERLKVEFGPRDFDWPKQVTRLSGEEAVSTFPKLFILGKPGAGKITFMKYTALRAIRQEIEKVPIFVSLKELSDSGKGIIDFLVHQFQTHCFPNAARFIEDLLKDGEGLVLFDGLDEVNLEADRRARLIQALNDFIYQYGDCSILLTCRVAETDYTFEQFEYVEMADFDEEQMTRYIDRWFVDNEAKRTSCKQALLENKSNAAVRELAQVPLLLSLLCLVYDERNEFPPNRDEIYEEAMQALLKKWDSSRNIARDTIYGALSYKYKVRLLTYLAAQTFEKGEYFLPERRVVKLLEEALEKVPGIKEADGETVLQVMEAQHGIFVERARRIHSFSHLTLQEYFTAKYIVDNEARGTLPRLMLHVGDRRWREVFLLTAGMLDDATEFCELFIAGIEQMIVDDAEVVARLEWALDKSRRDRVMISPPTLRALYLTFLGAGMVSTILLAIELDVNFNGDFERMMELDPDYALDTYISAAFLAISDSEQKFAEAMDQLIRKSGELSLTSLQVELEKFMLAAASFSSNEKYERLWDIVMKYRDFMPKHMVLGGQYRDVPSYRDYIEATALFVNCLQLAAVTKEQRETYKDILLLPPAKKE